MQKSIQFLIKRSVFIAILFWSWTGLASEPNKKMPDLVQEYLGPQSDTEVKGIRNQELETQFLQDYKRSVLGGGPQSIEGRLAEQSFHDTIRHLSAQQILDAGVDFGQDPAKAMQFWSLYESGRDFPNYFAEMAQKVSGGKVDTATAEKAIEKAMSAVLKRLQIPYFKVNPSKKGKENSLQISGFFAELNQTIQKTDPGAKVMIAGGVVRSLLGYLYQEIYNAKENNSKITPFEVLNKIAKATDPIPPISALGVGSDLDILIIPNDPEKSKKGKEAGLELINSAEKFSGIRDMKSKLKYSLVPIGDVKDYQEQMDRTTAQGGSTLDWLAFPITGGKMKIPAKAPQVFKNFILGTYDYLPSQSPSDLQATLPAKEGKISLDHPFLDEKGPGKKAEDSDKQTVRGLRSLVESPFLELSQRGQEQLYQELLELKKKVDNDQPLSPKALEQFEKLVRNARFQAGHNRFYRANGRIENLVLEIARNGIKKPLIPEFAMHTDPKKRKVKNRGLDHLLMDPADFRRDHTNNGVLYHGTSDENILSIIRNGFIISDQKQGQGASIHGRGVYATQKFEEAGGYGIPIEMKLKENITPRILNWDRVKDTSEIKGILKRAEEEKTSPFKILAQEYGIDVINNTYPLIQNTGILQIPQNLEDLIQIQRSRTEQSLSKLKSADFKESDIGLIAKNLNEYLSLERLALGMGLNINPLSSRLSGDASTPATIVLLQALLSENPVGIQDSLTLLKQVKLDENNKGIRFELGRIRRGLRKKMNEPELAASSYRILQQCVPLFGQSFQDDFSKIQSNPSFHQTLVHAMTRTFSGVPAAELLHEIDPALLSKAILEVKTSLLDPQSTCQSTATLKNLASKNSEIQSELKGTFDNPEYHLALAQALSLPTVGQKAYLLMKDLKDPKLGENVVEALKEGCRKYPSIRYAWTILEEFKHENEIQKLKNEKTVQVALVKVLSSPDYEGLSAYKIPDILKSIQHPDPLTIQALLQHDTSDPYTVQTLMGVIAEYTKNEENLNGLLSVLEDPNAFSSVISKPRTAAYVAHILHELTTNDPRTKTRRDLIFKNSDFQKSLIESLKLSHLDYDVLKSLEKILSAHIENSSVIDTLVPLLAGNRGYAASTILGELSRKHPDAIFSNLKQFLHHPLLGVKAGQFLSEKTYGWSVELRKQIELTLQDPVFQKNLIQFIVSNPQEIYFSEIERLIQHVSDPSVFNELLSLLDHKKTEKLGKEILQKLKPNLFFLQALSQPKLSKKLAEIWGVSEGVKQDLTKAPGLSQSEIQVSLVKGMPSPFETRLLKEIQPTDPSVHLALVKQLENKNSRYESRNILISLDLSDPGVHRALVDQLDNSESSSYAADILKAQSRHLSNPELQTAIVNKLANEKATYQAAQVLETLPITDPHVILVLVKQLGNKGAYSAANLLKSLHPTDPRVHLALVKELRVKSAASYTCDVLKSLDLSDPTVHNELLGISQDETWDLWQARDCAKSLLKKFNPQQPISSESKKTVDSKTSADCLPQQGTEKDLQKVQKYLESTSPLLSNPDKN